MANEKAIFEIKKQIYDKVQHVKCLGEFQHLDVFYFTSYAWRRELKTWWKTAKIDKLVDKEEKRK